VKPQVGHTQVTNTISKLYKIEQLPEIMILPRKVEKGRLLKTIGLLR
jgi:hypothetical protein